MRVTGWHSINGLKLGELRTGLHGLSEVILLPELNNPPFFVNLAFQYNIS
jgi:hypothetical protein